MSVSKKFEKRYQHQGRMQVQKAPITHLPEVPSSTK